MEAKEQLYYLLKSFEVDKYGTKDFCELFSDIYDHKTNNKDLDEIERRLFGELSVITNRFSPFEEDLKNYPGVYYDEQQVKAKVKEVIDELNKRNLLS